jgi:hypothetical protein
MMAELGESLRDRDPPRWTPFTVETPRMTNVLIGHFLN